MLHRKMKFESLDSGADGEYTGICFVEISAIFAKKIAFFSATKLFDRLKLYHEQY